MPNVFAFCSDITAFHENRIRDLEVCQHHPGARWVYEFAELVEPTGHRLISGDVALREIRNSQLEPSRVLILSEQDAAQAKQLLSAGARAGAVVCFESPLFADTFYARAASVCAPYPVKVLFQGTLDEHFAGDAEGCYRATIPVLSRTEVCRPVHPWKNRRDVVMVAWNKYWRLPFQRRFMMQPKMLEAWLRGKLRFSASAVKRRAMASQLHDERLRLIELLGSQGMLDLFGSGWLDPWRLPQAWWKRLGPILHRINPALCAYEDKQDTISHYRYALCIENNVYPGYLTEKLFDALAAGTIPLYLGDPLVSETIPQDTFVDLRQFPQGEDLLRFLEAVSPEKGTAYLEAGRRFIQSPEAAQFTFEGFAEAMYQRLKPHLS